MNLVEHFSTLEDPRILKKCDHKLIDVLIIAVCATLCRFDESWEAIEEFGIERQDWFKKFLELPNGIPSHDKNTSHGLCGGHLLRELKFVEDSMKYMWATKMKELLKQACHTVNKREKTRKLSEKEYKKLELEYRKILNEGKKEMPPFPEKTGKRGRVKCTDAQNLWTRLHQYKDSVLLFARLKEVDFTNNRAERDLRSSKLKQKVAGCFRTIEFAKYFCRISGYVKSMRYRGYSSFEAISLAVQGNIPD